MKRAFFLAIGLALTLAQCTKYQNNGGSGGTSQLDFHLADAPASYDSVLIDVQEVRVHIDGQGWQTLTTNNGIYNLLDYTSGTDTVIAGDSIPSGQISQVRLVLGTNNTVVVDGQSHNLITPSGQQSGLKLNVQENLADGLSYSFLLDFDAHRSIVETGNGQYILKPVIRVVTDGIDGGIEGAVDPASAQSFVWTVDGSDTAGTISDANGEWFLRGLSSGSYDVRIEPDTLYQDTVLTGINVTSGAVTNVGTITLQP